MSDVTENETWLITGVSSGLGASLAKLALEQGHHVIGTVRKPEDAARFAACSPGRAAPVIADFSDPDGTEAVIAYLDTMEVCPDVVVLNAGYGLLGAALDLSEDALRAQMQVNFHAPVALARAVMERVTPGHSITIVGISSTAALAAHPGLSAYSASKSALEAYLEALSAELAPLGHNVLIIEPGHLQTDWAGRSAKVVDVSPPFVASADRVIRSIRTADAHVDAGQAEIAAARILDLVKMPDAPLRAPLGLDAKRLLRNHLSQRSCELEALSDRFSDVSGRVGALGISLARGTPSLSKRAILRHFLVGMMCVLLPVLVFAAVTRGEGEANALLIVLLLALALPLIWLMKIADRALRKLLDRRPFAYTRRK